MIRIDCYVGILKKIKPKYPNAHFEYVNNRNILAPSKELLHKHIPQIKAYQDGKLGKKEIEKDFLEYEKEYTNEIFSDEKKIKRIKELKEISKNKILFLVCYCKDSNLCHRKIVKKLIEEI